MEMLVTEANGGTEAVWSVYILSSPSELGMPKLWGGSLNSTMHILSLVTAFLGVLVLQRLGQPCSEGVLCRLCLCWEQGVRQS